MIYVDTSVALAEILAEDRSPQSGFWAQPLVSSRLIEYEIWVRIHARRLADSHAEHVRWLLGRLALVELVSPVLVRAIEPFPAPVRTLDALHLATIEFLRDQGMTLVLAAYDERMRNAARRMKIPLHRL